MKCIIKRAVNIFGFDIVRTSKSPNYTLLDLKYLPVKTIIDVEANKGQFAKKPSFFYPNVQMYCFEPLSIPFKKLNEWAKKQNGRVKVFNMALGEHEGAIQMFYHSPAYVIF